MTALSGALLEAEGVWVAAAMSDGDREMVAASTRGRIDHEEGDTAYRLRYLDIPPETYDGYYNGISNGVLWFAHHYLWDTVRSPSFGKDVERSWEHYVDVNRRFALAMHEEGERLGPDPAFLVQDYHLSLVPQFLRELRSERPHRALLAHIVLRTDLLPHAAGDDPQSDAPGAARRRRARVPLAGGRRTSCSPPEPAGGAGRPRALQDRDRGA